MATKSADCARLVISQAAPTDWIHSPTLALNCPAQMLRKTKKPAMARTVTAIPAIASFFIV